MNHGKINSQQPEEDFTQKLNKRIGKLLGKKPNTPLPKDDTVKNWVFYLVATICVLFLWCGSGFYYLPDNQYGIVVKDGKFEQTLVGPDSGFTLPYPFASVTMIDGNTSDKISIGKKDDSSNGYLTITKDLVTLSVGADFSYQVTDPNALYLNHLQENNDIDQLIIWLTEDRIHKYISQNNSSDLLKNNLIVLSNQLREQINQNLLSYGIKLKTLNINGLKREALNSNVSTSQQEITAVTAETPDSNSSSVAQQLLDEANKYQRAHIALANANVEKFKQLLPQYKANSMAIVDQIYYQLLADVPIVNSNKYQLLELSLPDLLDFADKNIDTQKIKDDNTVQNTGRDLRKVDRSVNRVRNLNRATDE